MALAYAVVNTHTGKHIVGDEKVFIIEMNVNGVFMEMHVDKSTYQDFVNHNRKWIKNAKIVPEKSGMSARSVNDHVAESKEKSSSVSRQNTYKKSQNIRKWARENGYVVATRGRIASKVHVAYEKAHAN